MADNLWRPAGVNFNVNNSLNWSLLAVPTAADGNVAVFDGNGLSGPVTINAAFAPNNLDMSAYVNTITMTNGVTVTGNIILGSGMTVSGSGLLTQSATGNLTSNGFTWPNALTLSGTAMTHTLTDNWIVTGAVIITGNTSQTLNGLFTLRCNGNFSQTNSATTTAGTATIIMGGTGSLSQTGSATLRNNFTIDTSGTITFGAGFAYNTGIFTHVTGTVDFTTNSNTFTSILSTTFNVSSAIVFNNLTFSGSSQVLTLGGDIWVGRNFSTGAATSTSFVGAFNVYVGINLTIASNGNWNTGAGFLGIIWNGSGATGVWSGLGNVNTNLTINGSGTLTVSGAVTYRTGTFTHVSGTVVTTGSTLNVFNGTFNVNGITWNNVTNSSAGSSTQTLTSNMNINGTLTLGSGTSTCTFNGAQINLGGNFINGVTNGNVAGTTVINVIGNCVWTMISWTTGTTRMPITINNSGFTFTFSGSLNYSTGIITYTSGTIVNTSSTLNFAGTITCNASGFSLNALVCSGNSTFNGTNGFTVATWTCTTIGLTHTFKNGNTYIITTALVLTATAASPKNLVSSTPGSQFIFTLNQGATQDVYYTNATDPNSSAGQTIWDFKGTLSNATNWRLLTPPTTISHGYSI